VDGHGHKVAEDAVIKTPCVVIIFDEAPRYREVQSKPESKHPRMTASRDRTSSQTETREETLPRTRSAVARQGRSWYVLQGDNWWEKRLLIGGEKMEEGWATVCVWICGKRDGRERVCMCVYLHVCVCVCVCVCVYVWQASFPSSLRFRVEAWLTTQNFWSRYLARQDTWWIEMSGLLPSASLLQKSPALPLQ